MAQCHDSLEITYQNSSITNTSKPTLVFWLLIQGSFHQNMQFVVLASALMGRLRSSEGAPGQKDIKEYL